MDNIKAPNAKGKLRAKGGTNIAIIFAGGSGRRMDGFFSQIPKQFLSVAGKPILVHTIELFQRHAEIDWIYVAVPENYTETMSRLGDSFRLTKIAGVVPGGETSQDSIFMALKAAARNHPPESIAMMHDGVRPLITERIISDNIACARNHGTAITIWPCHETILYSKDGKSISGVPPRNEVYVGQAPQTMVLGEILSAHEKIRRRPGRYDGLVDSCTIYHALGLDTRFVEGSRANIKVTTPEDVYLLRSLLRYQEDIENFGIFQRREEMIPRESPHSNIK